MKKIAFILMTLLALNACSQGDSKNFAGDENTADLEGKKSSAGDQEEQNNPSLSQVALSPILAGGLKPTHEGEALKPSLNSIANLIPKTLLIHASDCSNRSNASSTGEDGSYKKISQFLCPVKLPDGSQLKSITAYPLSLDLADDPVQGGLISMQAAAGTYTWKNDLQVKSVYLKSDRSGYNTKIVTDCGFKDWQYTASIQPKKLNCEFTKKEDNTLYIFLEADLKTNNETAKDLSSAPPFVNLIAVEYYSNSK
ncbi:MAG: hypothetical protein JNK65_02595 [Deltaproteobacteria bacterium]|nr:hypothetical protein [Deltaproteobacteria bacterium]